MWQLYLAAFTTLCALGSIGCAIFAWKMRNQSLRNLEEVRRLVGIKPPEEE